MLTEQEIRTVLECFSSDRIRIELTGPELIPAAAAIQALLKDLQSQLLEPEKSNA